VLGFEYGYSVADPMTLTLWEAQFGDFANGAQVIIDQFISCANVKWQRISGLVMLLPHGYEGQGPEHSSARIERYLQLCADDNMQVVNCSTPAQYFHVLRRQMMRRSRSPLIIFTPKSLLRLARAGSQAADLALGTRFQVAIDDVRAEAKRAAVTRVVLCSGKVYYDLLDEQKRRHGDAEVPAAIVRVEQLHPWPEERLAEILSSYPNLESVVWCQEEPANMGAWTYASERIRSVLSAGGWLRPEGRWLHYSGRAAAASPAVGSARIHQAQQASLVAAAFDDL
jgi:2-oxoglutarate dehydrogenase E1 component